MYSSNDMYRSDRSCFLNDICMNNKLEYVHIEVNSISDNIVRTMVLSKNISDLHYLHI